MRNLDKVLIGTFAQIDVLFPTIVLANNERTNVMLN